MVDTSGKEHVLAIENAIIETNEDDSRSERATDNNGTTSDYKKDKSSSDSAIESSSDNNDSENSRRDDENDEDENAEINSNLSNDAKVDLKDSDSSSKKSDESNKEDNSEDNKSESDESSKSEKLLSEKQESNQSKDKSETKSKDENKKDKDSSHSSRKEDEHADKEEDLVRDKGSDDKKNDEKIENGSAVKDAADGDKKKQTVDDDDKTSDDEKLEKMQAKESDIVTDKVEAAKTSELSDKPSNQPVATTPQKSSTRRSILSSLMRPKTVIYEDKKFTVEKYSIVICNSKNFSSSTIFQLAMRKICSYIVFTSEKTRKAVLEKVSTKCKDLHVSYLNFGEITGVVEDQKDLDLLTQKISDLPGKLECIYVTMDTTPKHKRVANNDGIEEGFFRNHYVPRHIMETFKPSRALLIFDANDFGPKKSLIAAPGMHDLHLGQTSNRKMSRQAKENARKTVIFEPGSVEATSNHAAASQYTDPRILVYLAYILSFASKRSKAGHLPKKSELHETTDTTLYCIHPKKKFFSSSYAQSIDGVLLNETNKTKNNNTNVAFFDGKSPMSIPKEIVVNDDCTLAYLNINDAIKTKETANLPKLVQYFQNKGQHKLKSFDFFGKPLNDDQISQKSSVVDEKQVESKEASLKESEVKKVDSDKSSNSKHEESEGKVEIGIEKGESKDESDKKIEEEEEKEDGESKDSDDSSHSSIKEEKSHQSSDLRSKSGSSKIDDENHDNSSSTSSKSSKSEKSVDDKSQEKLSKDSGFSEKEIDVESKSDEIEKDAEEGSKLEKEKSVEESPMGKKSSDKKKKLRGKTLKMQRKFDENGNTITIKYKKSEDGVYYLTRSLRYPNNVKIEKKKKILSKAL